MSQESEKLKDAVEYQDIDKIRDLREYSGFRLTYIAELAIEKDRSKVIDYCIGCNINPVALASMIVEYNNIEMLVYICKVHLTDTNYFITEATKKGNNRMLLLLSTLR